MSMKQLQPVSGMRDVMALARHETVDKVCGYTWRSEAEVLAFVGEMKTELSKVSARLATAQAVMGRYPLVENAATPISINRGAGGGNLPELKNRGVVDVAPIKVQNLGKLKDSFALLNDLQEKMEVLDTLEVQVNHAFRGEKGNKIPGVIKATRDQYAKKLNTAMKFLRETAERYEPAAFKKLVVDITNYFKDGFDHKYSEATEQVFLTPGKPRKEGGAPVLVFNHYVQFKNLVNEHMEYTYPIYIVVYTAVVDEEGSMSVYVNTLHKFRAPGTFKYGQPFKDLRSGVNSLGMLFEVDDFVDLLDRQPVPFKGEDIKGKMGKFASKEFIKDSDVEDNKILVTLNDKVTKKNIAEVAGKVWADVRGMLASFMKTNLRPKIVPPTSGKGSYKLEFVLILPTDMDTKKFMTPQKLDRLKEELELDDGDVKKIIQLFNRG